MVRAALLCLALLPVVGNAQERPRLGLTLAGADQVGDACRLSFLAENGLGVALSALTLEAVVFTRQGGVERLMLLEFRDLPKDKSRLRQFDLTGTDCGALGQILINGADQCAGAPEGHCIAALVPGSRVEGLEVTG